MLLPISAAAQIRFGYISYDAVVSQMPQFAQAQQQLADLKGKYEQEANRSEEEFQRKFTDFLQGQKEFPQNILQKRQAELQDLMERSIAFRKEAQNLLVMAEKDLLQDVYRQLNAAITAVAVDGGYAFVLNSDDNSTPYINPQIGDDITDLVRIRLGIIKPEPTTPPVVNEEPAPTPDSSDPAVQPVGEQQPQQAEGGVPTQQ